MCAHQALHANSVKQDESQRAYKPAQHRPVSFQLAAAEAVAVSDGKLQVVPVQLCQPTGSRRLQTCSGYSTSTSATPEDVQLYTDRSLVTGGPAVGHAVVASCAQATTCRTATHTLFTTVATAQRLLDRHETTQRLFILHKNTARGAGTSGVAAPPVAFDTRHQGQEQSPGNTEK